MESKGILNIVAVIAILVFNPITVFSDSDIQSIDATVDVKPYENNRVELDIIFSDDKGQNVKRINYDIAVTQNGKTVFEQIVYDADGRVTHITDSLDSFSSIKITIKVKGLGLSPPYAGPTSELFFVKSITTHYFTAYADKAKYSDGDMMRIYGNISNDEPISVSMIIQDPSSDLVYVKQTTLYNNEFSFDLIAGGEVWNESGEYIATVNHGGNIAETVFWFDTKTNIPKNSDNVVPLLIVPEDILVNTQDNQVRVTYSVKGIDDVDGILQPTCNPASGSYFGIGDTLVTCSVKDSSGNNVQEKFLVTVQGESNDIPVWVKDVAGFWCSGEIDDTGFIEGIQYLIENNVIVMPKTTPNFGNSGEIPDWVKNNACWWSEGAISDKEFSNGIQYLISNGIVRTS